MYIEINDKKSTQSIGAVRDHAILQPPLSGHSANSGAESAWAGLMHDVPLDFEDGASNDISHQQDCAYFCEPSALLVVGWPMVHPRHLVMHECNIGCW